LADQYAKAPEVVDEGIALLALTPGEPVSWQPRVDWVSDRGEFGMWQTARYNWSLIPAEIRAALPDALGTWTIRLVKSKDERRLYLRESSRGWIVFGIGR
jgi:hypothetical protein